MKSKQKGIFSSIAGILTYRPPKDEYKFELLEPENEDRDDTPVQIKELEKVSKSLKDNLDTFNRELNASQDMAIKEFKIGKSIKALIAYSETLVDMNIISSSILKPLMDSGNFQDKDKGEELITYIIQNVLPTNLATERKEFKEVIDDILVGYTVIFIDGQENCISLETQGFEKRSVDKPTVENVVMGPQEGFTESIKTNISLVRKIIRSKDLITEMFYPSPRDRISVCIMYLKDIANQDLVKEVRRRINNIKPSTIVGTGILEQLIEDNPLMPFPQVLHTERPDKTASCLLEGKVAIIEGGSPFVLVVPSDIIALFHSPEDSYLRWHYGSAIRLIRLLGFYIALILPGLYVSLVTYHQEVIPTDLLMAIGIAKEGVPFPSVIEVLIMEISFELIREAGIRVPSQIGNTLGIVGAIILGQAAVAANLVSPVLIIVASVTGLGSFAIPSYSMATGVRLLKFFFIFLGSMLGFVGISIGLVLMTGALTYMKSFGVPFLSPKLASARKNKDLLLRFPAWQQEYRPDSYQPQDKKRQPEISRKWAFDKPDSKEGD